MYENTGEELSRRLAWLRVKVSMKLVQYFGSTDQSQKVQKWCSGKDDFALGLSEYQYPGVCILELGDLIFDVAVSPSSREEAL